VTLGYSFVPAQAADYSSWSSQAAESMSAVAEAAVDCNSSSEAPAECMSALSAGVADLSPSDAGETLTDEVVTVGVCSGGLGRKPCPDPPLLDPGESRDNKP
jgi:hypothetical protein